MAKHVFGQAGEVRMAECGQPWIVVRRGALVRLEAVRLLPRRWVIGDIDVVPEGGEVGGERAAPEDSVRDVDGASE
jgi:hypothetical protein